MTTLRRRTLLSAAGAAVLGAAHTRTSAQGQPHVVVVGGGFGGATAAKYLRRFNPALRVTLVEPQDQFISCPVSNRVLHGGISLKDLSRPYDRFAARYNLQWVRGMAEDIDPVKRELVVGGTRLNYDRLVLSPGVDFVYAEVPGLQTAAAQTRVPHAWKAGAQTLQLRQMLQAMRPGGVVAMHIPKVPYRCPPGPYERASLIAYFLQNHNPKGKLLVYDSNPDIQSKKGLFEAVWRGRYSGLLEYVPNAELESVDAASLTLNLQVHGKHKVDVLNLIPPQRAGDIARRAGLTGDKGRWCGVDFLTYESTAQKNIHVIGDAIASAPGTPKSGHMANQQAKVCASAIAALTLGQPVPDQPIIANTCYSFVSNAEVIHVAAVYRYDRERRTMVSAPGAGGLSPAATQVEGVYAMTWASNILNDSVS